MTKSETPSFGTLANLLPKLRNPLQVAGLAIFAVVYVLTTSRSNIKDAFAGFGFLLILYGQVFGSIEKIPEHSRARFLFGSLLLGTLAFVSALLITRALEPSATSKSEGTPHYSPAEQTVVDLRSQIDQIRGSYGSLLEYPDKAPEVNRDARLLADRLSAVDDATLGEAIQVYKYEALAYCWAMVTGSEPDSAKLKTIDEVLRVTDKGQQLIEDVMRPGPFDQRIQNWREWIIKDNAVQRLQRLTAVALCARWQVKRNGDDLVKVRQIVENFPYDYREGEDLQSSFELRPCLSGTGDNQGRTRGAALPEKETKQE